MLSISRNWKLFWGNSTPYTLWYYIKLRLLLILSVHLRITMQQDLFASYFLSKVSFITTFFSIRSTCLTQNTFLYCVYLLLLKRSPKTLTSVVEAVVVWTWLLTSSSATVNNVWNYTSIPPYVFIGLRLIKRWDSFTLTFTSNNAVRSSDCTGQILYMQSSTDTYNILANHRFFQTCSNSYTNVTQFRRTGKGKVEDYYVWDITLMCFRERLTIKPQHG
jgi:hypothetical protein